MPCEDCGQLLVREFDSRSLFCPRCKGLPVESQKVVNAKVNWLTKDYYTNEKIVNILQDYSKVNLIYTLFNRLNQASFDFYDEFEQGLPISEFGYTTYLLKQIYQFDEFGNELIEDRPESNETVEIVRDAFSEVITRLHNARNEFSVCIRNNGFTNQMENFASDYSRMESEYGLCFSRCRDSVVGGDPDNLEDFSFVADELRAVDRISATDAETPTEFGDALFQIIESLRFLAASDDMIGPTYYTKFPKEVSFLDFREFLNMMDGIFGEKMREKIDEEAWIPPVKKHLVERCGREAFGNNWKEVREQIVLSEDNLDAHPLLFELDFRVKRQLPGFRLPTAVPEKQIYYPRYFAQLLKFQIFPLLQNGEKGDSGHQILSNLTAERGKKRERNLYNFLTDHSIECYHGAETQKNKNEVDLLCIREDRIQIIEVKYLMPPIRINGPEGIRVLNEKFNLLIFNEESENTARKPEGKPFPEKVEAWKGLEPDDKFRSQVNDDGKYQQQSVPENWNELNIEMLVVSNVVPSYIEKEEVRFITDLELYQMVEKGEDVFYELP